MHHQRGAEPYTLGREGRRAVEVDFRRNIIIRRQPRTPGAQHPRTDNERKYAQCDQYTHRDRSLPNQYTQHKLTMTTATDQNTATTLTSIRRDRTNPPHLPPLTTYGRPYNLPRLVRPILPISRAILSPLVRGIPTTNTHHENRYKYQAYAAEPYFQNATVKLTTRFTSANGARHQVLRTVQRIAILPCCA